MSSCFISYGRKDDEQFVKDLYSSLINDGIDVWWDREAMESRGVSFLSVIDEAIRSVDRIIFVIGPSALKSTYVNHEISVAKEHCKIIIPVIRIGEPTDLPEEFNQHIYILKDEGIWEYDNLIKELKKKLPKLAQLLGEVPPQPGHLINRTQAIDFIQKKVLAEVNDPVAICGGIKATTITGMGGIGKTVLASLVASSCKIRREFSEGVVFVRLQSETSSLEVINILRRILKDQIIPGDTLFEARKSLSRIFAIGRRLLILDNIWSVKQIADIVSITNATANRLLFTTRLKNITSDIKAQIYELDLLDEQQSLDFLANWLDKKPSELPDFKYKIVERCGRLPLALSICGALLQSGTHWNDLAEALEESEIYYLDREIIGYEYPGVFAAMDVGYKDLQKKDKKTAYRFRQLVVFDPGFPVPEQVVFKLWEVKSDQEIRKARYQLNILANRSLITVSESGSITIHDVIFTYLKNLGEDIFVLRKKIINAFSLDGSQWSIIAENNIWLRDNLVDYLLSYKDFEELEKLLCEENSLGENAWYQLRSNSGEIDKYWDDLTKIYNRLNWKNFKVSLPLASRLAIMKSSILSLEKNIPGNLIYSALKWEIWTPERALIQLRRIPQKIESLVGLILLFRTGKINPIEIIDDFFLKLNEININDYGINKLKNTLKDFSENLPKTSFTYAHEKVYNFLLISDEHLFKNYLKEFIFLFEYNDYDRILSLVENRSLSASQDLYAKAILGQLLSEEMGIKNIEKLVSKTSNYREIAKVAILSIRNEKNSEINIYIAKIFNELNDNAECPEVYGNEEIIELLAELPVDAIDQVVLNVDQEKLVLRFNNSPFVNLKNIAKCAKHKSLHTVLLKSIENMEDSYSATGAIAAIVNYAPEEYFQSLLTMVNERLDKELTKAEMKSDWTWIGDVARYYGPVFKFLSKENRKNLINSIPKIYNIEMAAKTIVGLSENLSKMELMEAIEKLLSELSRTSGYQHVTETLNTISPLLNKEQTDFALSIAQAARDDGFETSYLYDLIKHLPALEQERVNNWIIDRNFEHLNLSTKQISKDWSIAQFIGELVDIRVSENLLSRLEKLAIDLKDNSYTISALAKVATAFDNVHSEEIWIKIDQLLYETFPGDKPGKLLAILASTAKGKRKAKYLKLALEEEDRLAGIKDDIYSRTNILKELPASDEVSARIIKLLQDSRSKYWDHIIEELISKIEPETLVELIESNSWYFKTDKTKKRVSKQLAKFGYENIIFQFCYYNGDYKTIEKKYLDILYNYLPLDQVDMLLVESPDNPDLIVRLAELKDYNRAFNKALALKPGNERLQTVIRCCQYITNKELKEKYLLEAMPDLEHIDILNHLYECIHKGTSELIKLSQSTRVDAYRIITDVLKEKIRLQSLSGLYLSSQVVYSLIGESGVIATFNAVEDVCRWWPSYPRRKVDKSE